MSTSGRETTTSRRGAAGRIAEELFKPRKVPKGRELVEKVLVDEYVISAPTGYRAAAGTFRLALRDLHNHGGVDILHELHETGEKLARMTDEQLRELRASYPQLVVEPNLTYKLLRHPGFEGLSEPFSAAAGSTREITITATDRLTNAPIGGAKVYVVLDAKRKLGHTLTTDHTGTCGVRTKPDKIAFISVVPRAGYWSGLLEKPAPAATYNVALETLTPTTYGWGHTAANMRAGLATGAGVTVAIIDTGVRADHPDLAPAGGLNCVRGEPSTTWDDDEDGHGTHCAGIIAGRGNMISGYVPGAAIRSYRIFPRGQDADLYAITTALQAAIDDRCDIISMSFGRPHAQDTIRAKIEQAYDKGILCVGAAGNDATHVYYPAAFYPVVAVSAFGELATYPASSAHRRAETTPVGQRFVADFSNFGPEIAVIAPGVAVVSTVPEGYAAWDGTSMAAPHVTGMAALLLAQTPAILNAPRDGNRVDQLLKLLLAKTTLLGVGRDREGSGFPQLP